MKDKDNLIAQLQKALLQQEEGGEKGGSFKQTLSPQRKDFYKDYLEN